ncbi:MAG: CTP synthase [Candidatus Micrarchaeaceae archaeon]
MPIAYIVVTGGVISGLGKGITTASIGKVLQSKGFKVTAIKIDPYLNFDAGTLRPTEHGEVWVTEDGGETDEDLGHYERFLDVKLGKKNNITTGQVYLEVIEKERSGEYLGKTVQIIPQVTDEIKRRIRDVAKESLADFVLIEIGGVVGDYENIPFLEAVRQMKLEGEKMLFVHVGYLPVVKSLGEMKTKPIQHSVKEIRALGIQPDFIVCRSEGAVDSVRREKIALFCNVTAEDIIANQDLENVYELPLLLESQKVGDKILAKLNLEGKPSNLEEWKNLIEKSKGINNKVKIGIVGKYFDVGEYSLADSYISVIEAVKHAAWHSGTMPIFSWIDAKSLEANNEEEMKKLKSVDGLIIPGGFGSSGVEGKIRAIRFARESNLPLLGLCFGLQLIVVEFARNVCGLRDAHSTEINPNTENPVVDLLPWQKELMKESKYGATMRLGGQTVLLKEHTLAYTLYGKIKVVERFRHRYEINPRYVEILEKNGFVFSGESEKDEGIMQIGELPNLDFFIGTQFHPELTSRPLRPNPLFLGFIKSAKARASRQ